MRVLISVFNFALLISGILFASQTFATDDDGIFRKGDFRFEVSRAKALAYAADLQNTLKSAKMSAEKDKGGKTVGFQFETIDRGSVFEKLGFKTLDVLTHVNGDPIRTPSEAMALLPSLPFQDEFAVRAVRAKKTITLYYTLIN